MVFNELELKVKNSLHSTHTTQIVSLRLHLPSQIWFKNICLYVLGFFFGTPLQRGAKKNVGSIRSRVRNPLSKTLKPPLAQRLQAHDYDMYLMRFHNNGAISWSNWSPPSPSSLLFWLPVVRLFVLRAQGSHCSWAQKRTSV